MKKILALLLALALCAGLSVPALAAGFSDVPAGHYAASAIDACVAKGIVSGYADGTFKPGNQVTRAQFCVMIARAFYSEELRDYETAENKAAGWFVPAVECLHNLAYDGGALESTNFEEHYRDPAVMNQPINRYDAATLVWFCTPPGAPFLNQAQREQTQRRIADWASVPDQYYYPVTDCFAWGVLTGLPDGSFGGDKTLNRGQACAVIDRMLNLGNGGTAAQPPETPKPEESPKPAQPVQPAPETPAPSGGDLQSMRQGVLELVNAARAENGKTPLTLNDALCEAAQLRADEIVETFSHTRPDGTDCFTALREAGITYRTCGENIAAGQSTPASVMDTWMNSSGHRANILNGSFSSIGIGYVNSGSGYGHYWVQMFVG